MKEHNEVEDKKKPYKASQRACILVVAWLASLVWSALTFGVFCYLAIGSILLFSTDAKMEVVFMNRLRLPLFANLSDCSGFGLPKCEHFYIQGEAGKIGAWFITPSSKQYIVHEAYFLYLHGNTATRAYEHRVQLYKRLSKMGFHVLTIDYRGYGDSEGWPSELGLVEDAKDAYRWLKEKSKGHPIYIWGHSLGSAYIFQVQQKDNRFMADSRTVAVQLAAWLNAERSLLNGVFLEAPFNNLTDGIKQTIFVVPVAQVLPNFESYIDDVKNIFRTSYWIHKVHTPIMMYHDKSDRVLNINLARRLYLHAKEVGTCNVNLIEFDEQLYHQDIYAAKNLKALVMEFVRSTS